MKNINVDTLILPGLHQWQLRADRVHPSSTVIFGDSLLTCNAQADLTQLIAQRLAEHDLPTSIVRVGHPAFSPIHFYYLLDEILAGGSDRVIVEINLRLFTPYRGYGGSMRLRNLSRELSFSRALRIRQALAAEDLSLLDPPIYRLEDALDALYLPDGVQLLGGDVLATWGEAINRHLRLRNVAPEWRAVAAIPHDRARWARREYGSDQTSHPFAGVLREALLDLHRAHVPVLFYVSPINLAWLRQAGVEEELRLGERIEALRRAIGAAPAEWLDLHAAAPAGAFRDSEGHMTLDGCEPAAHAIGDRLAARAHQ